MITSCSPRLARDRAGLAAIALGLLCACGEEPVDRSDFLQLPLPGVLREVSGLVATEAGRLLAIADERGRVYEIDFDRASIKRFADFGDPAVEGDFEALAIKDGLLYAATSSGVLYRRDLDDPDAKAFERFETGLGRACEIEGLAAHPSHPHLWLLCKEPRKKRHKGELTLFAWAPAEATRAPGHDIAVPFAELGFKKPIAPSGAYFSEAGGELWIVAARQQVFVVVTSTGELVRSGRLPNRRWHPQTEGIAISAGSIYLADEGKQGEGVLSRYRDGF